MYAGASVTHHSLRRVADARFPRDAPQTLFKTKTRPKRHRHVTRTIARLPNLANIAGVPRTKPVFNQKDGEMKGFLAVLLPIALSASAAFGLENENSTASWNSIVGVITAPGVDNPVGTIHGGAGPWSVRSGRAHINLSNGFTSFDVNGLVLNGSASSGTPGAITSVKGTLVCNSGGAAPTILDTTAVSLNVHGDARFAGHISDLPATCDNPVFLIRIVAPAGAAGRWIATGAERFIDDDER